MKSRVKEILNNLGADVCGIANIDRFCDSPTGFSPLDIYKDCKSVIVFGVSIPKGITQINPQYIYGHFNTKNCDRVDNICFNSSKQIEKEMNCNAVPVPCDSPYEYWNQEALEGRGLMSMRHAAFLAGIGSIGKSGLLLNRDFGTLLTIGVILTDMDLESDALADEICIENCTRCLDSCPVSAIEHGVVNQKLCRTNTYSTNDRGFDIVNCNNCRVMCPIGKR